MSVKSLRYGTVAPALPFHAAHIQIAAGVTGTPPHGHADFVEFMLVTDGSVVHHVNGVEQLLDVGDLVLVRTSDVHSFWTPATNGVKFINVAIPVFAWRALAVACDVPADGLASGAVPPSVPAAHDRSVEVSDAMHGALAAFHRGPAGLDRARLWVAATAALTARGHAEAEPPWPAWLTDAATKMTEEHNLRGGVDRFADLAAVSRGHLARMVRAAYGQSPVEYVTALRLARAAALLSSGGEPVGTIAKRCGFSSLSYFSRKFTQAHGLSPRAYRRAVARQADTIVWPRAEYCDDTP